MTEQQPDPQTSPFGRLYPNLFLWLTYGGRLSIQPASETEVEVWLGDPGGYPEDGCRRGTLDVALEVAEKFAAAWRLETQRLQRSLITDTLPETRRERYIRVTGWPAIPNPNYDPDALPDDANSESNQVA